MRGGGVALFGGLAAAAALLFLSGEEDVELDGSTKASKWFDWAELVRSSKAKALGLQNIPSAGHRANLRKVCAQLDIVRERLGVPIKVTSGYRTVAVNAAVGGVDGSQHTTGEAVDVAVEGMHARDLAQAFVDAGVPYDQLIWYPPERGNWVHYSLSASGDQRFETRWSPVAKSYPAWSPA